MDQFTFEVSEDGEAVSLVLHPGTACDLLRHEAKSWWGLAGKSSGKLSTQYKQVARTYEKMADDISLATLLNKRPKSA